MNVLYTCDDNYVWLMGISMISLFENNKEVKILKVYLLGENISYDNKNLLEYIAIKYNREVIIMDIPHFNIPKALISERWPLSAFTRLFSGILLPTDVDKILYLDCDTIIRSNISELEFDMKKDQIFGGVKDCIGASYKKNIGLNSKSNYINAGVLVINLNELRKKNVGKLIENYLNRFASYITYADQDILNAIFNKNIFILDAKYNVMTIAVKYSYKEIYKLRHPTQFYDEREFEIAVRNPYIVHYTTNMRNIRPWYSNTNHFYSDDFKKYLMISPWKSRELKEFKFTTYEALIISIIHKLPKSFANLLLGIIHSEIKPILIRIKAIIKMR